MKAKANKKELSIIINEMKKPSPKITYIKKILKQYRIADINLNSKYYHGKTLLHYAIEYNLNCLIQPFIQSGCNPNICDDNYLSPLHLAVIKKNAKAIKILDRKSTRLNSSHKTESRMPSSA